MREFPRKLRINAQMQGDLSLLIREELSDPRVAGVTVTAVDCAPDLRNAKVLVSLIGDDEQLKQAVKALNNAGGKLRGSLARRMALRHAPELRFVADTQLRDADKVNALLKVAIREDSAHPDYEPGPADKDDKGGAA